MPFTHPELREGEMFLSNISSSDVHLLEEWHSARVGNVAYDINDKRMTYPQIRPVFVLQTEYDARQSALARKLL